MENNQKELQETISVLKKVSASSEGLELINSIPFLYSFSKRLTDFIVAHGYCGSLEGENSLTEKTEFVLNHYQSISYSISKSTIKDWFRDKHIPVCNSNSKDEMYALCFAFHLTVEEAAEFFRTVYLQRAFYCRNYQEAVFYYSFLHGYDYNTAIELHQKVEKSLSEIPAPKTPFSYTLTIQNKLKEVTTEEELISYLTSNQSNFLQYNNCNHNKEALSNNLTAREKIQKLLEKLRGTKEDKDLIRHLKASPSLRFNHQELNGYGYAIQEYLCFSHDDSFEFLKKKNISSISFLLYCILDIDLIEEKKQNPNFSFHKGSKLHQAIRTAFPAKHKFSEILSPKSKYVTDDMVRKTLILLEFYTFWVTEKLSAKKIRKQKSTDEKLFQTFVKEMNQELHDCGFDNLYYKNPYDFLFLYASYSEAPLDTFRNIISDAIAEET